MVPRPSSAAACCAAAWARANGDDLCIRRQLVGEAWRLLLQRHARLALLGTHGNEAGHLIQKLQATLSELCQERDGKFRMLDAVFEQEGDSLYIYGLKYDGTQTVEKACTVDGWPVPATSWSRFKLRPGQVVELNGEKFTVFRNVVAHA